MISFSSNLENTDPDISFLINKEFLRQQNHLELIASENFASQAVMQAQGSVLTNKYAEGLPGKRYYGGCEHIDEIEKLKTQFYNDINIPTGSGFNMELEKAGRLSDFLELGQLMALDALKREESCGGHFREEFQTDENEALRNDEKFAYVAAWGYNRDISNSNLNKEILEFNNVKLTTRSYK